MKATFFAAATAIMAGMASAQYNISSGPFVLIAKSKNVTYDNVTFAPCHEGAAIEGLCVASKYNASGSGTYYTYGLNTSSYEQSNPAQYPYGVPGALTYELQGANFNESEPMSFFTDISTNVALPLFEPSYDTTYVAFDKNNYLNVQSYLNDTVTPPNSLTVHAHYRWNICETNFEGYTYTTLAWVMGKEKAQNPSCVAVEITRVFVPAAAN